jgi:hypothetical protein
LVVVSPPTDALFAADHVKFEPFNEEVRFRLTASPLQIVNCDGLVTVGNGLTVTLTVCGKPLHPLTEG